MKGLSSTHNHCTFCDGKNTPEEMAHAAFLAGFSDFGFSSHSYDAQERFGVADERAYAAALRALAREYEGCMHISVGLEQDSMAPVHNRAALDYIIGSVHWVDCGAEGRFMVDGDKEQLLRCRSEVFGGDGAAMARRFFAQTAENVLRWRPEIIGHFDLIVKNNADGALFDEESRAYRDAALEALHVCAQTGAVFEVNTGGVYRGYRTQPYPAPFLLRELRRIGARVTVNADAHETAALTYGLAEARALLRGLGFAEAAVLRAGALVDEAL